MEFEANQEGGKNALYKVAYDEATRALSEQRAELASIRTHAGMLLSAAAITTSFLGAQAVADGSLGVAGWAALAGFAAVAAISLAILRPHRWRYSVSAAELIDGYIEGETAVPIEVLRRTLALHMHSSYMENWRGIGLLSRLFEIASGMLMIEVLLWIAAIV